MKSKLFIECKSSVSEKLMELKENTDSSKLTLEICGSWLWITGKTFPIKDILQNLGFRYSANKRAFYYRQNDHRSNNLTPLTIEKIHELYGASVITM